jgi:16S rRNA (cytosine1402-N4)-methyltransferase
MPSVHVPVLVDRVVEALVPTAPGVLVDATVGLGGHSEALLGAAPGFQLLGVDRDPKAVADARRRLAPFASRVDLVNAAFDEIPRLLAERELPAPVAILADLGCSSLQLDTPERGFSFSSDGPLDMRMGGPGRTAAELVNTSDREDLVRVFWRFGEERHSRSIARAIVRRREEKPFTRTGELADLVERIVGRRSGRRIHPATRVFQALRIAVNDELGQLERFLEPALRSLQLGGRIAIIAFHSLEDRIVKRCFAGLEGRCTCPPGFPECRCDPERLIRVITRSPIRPDGDEVQNNPRSRSAHLRVAERIVGS